MMVMFFFDNLKKNKSCKIRMQTVRPHQINYLVVGFFTKFLGVGGNFSHYQSQSILNILIILSDPNSRPIIITRQYCISTCQRVGECFTDEHSFALWHRRVIRKLPCHNQYSFQLSISTVNYLSQYGVTKLHGKSR